LSDARQLSFALEPREPFHVVRERLADSVRGDVSTTAA
jgi:hypothetical protein